MNVLTVCLGNICRSPLCAVVLARGGELNVRSVGFLEGGRPVHRKVRAYVHDVFGLDMSDHRSRQITISDIAWSDLIVCMSQKHIDRLKSLVPRKEHWWVRNLGDYASPVMISIPDPNFVSDPEKFTRILDLITKASTNLRNEIIAKRQHENPG